jgi:hypothetical protein
MGVYVDQIRDIIHFGSDRRNGFRHPRGCHMMADDESELEAMANLLGLRKAWRHGDHYDLTPNKRAQAVLLGANEISNREMVLVRNERWRMHGEQHR